MLKVRYSKGDTRWQATVFDHKELVQKLAFASELAGWKLTCQKQVGNYASHLTFSRNGKSEQALIYLWNLQSQSEDNGKLELCAEVDEIFDFNSVTEKTLLLEYDDSMQNFVGWDAVHNLRKLGVANTILTVPEANYSRVYPDGLAFYPRNESEVVVVFQPDAFINYICNLDHFHGAVSESEQNALVYMSQESGRLEESEIEVLPQDRQTSVKAIADCWASTNFRRCVLAAYGGRCAMCSGYRDAYLPTEPIHIVPAGQQGSSNKTSNGLCLCELHHRAFDQGLIAILPDYHIVINRTRLALLQSQSLSAGEESFIGNLQIKIDLPRDRAKRPNALLIEAALRVRGLGQDSLERTPRKAETEQL